MIKTLIIDSNSEDLNILQQTILKNFPFLKICGLTSSIIEARSLLAEYSPNLIFVEAEMSINSRSAFLNEVSILDWETVIMANSVDVICKIFKYKVGGFLLKPIKMDNLKEMISITQARIETKMMERKIDQEKTPTLKSAPGNLVGIPCIEGYDFFSIDKIIRCEGFQNSTRVIIADKSDIISSYSLGVFRKTLETYHFFSPHKSHLVNLKHIRKYYKEGTIQMSDQSTVPVSKRRKSEFLNLMLLSR